MNKIKHNIKYNINEQSKTEALCFCMCLACSLLCTKIMHFLWVTYMSVSNIPEYILKILTRILGW